MRALAERAAVRRHHRDPLECVRNQLSKRRRLLAEKENLSITHVAPDMLLCHQNLVQVFEELACRVQVYQIGKSVVRASAVRA